MTTPPTTDAPPPHHKPHPAQLRLNWMLIGFLAVAGFFLLTEHQAHVLGALPFLLLLACPLMHFFGHGGHGGHGGSDAGDARNAKEDKK